MAIGKINKNNGVYLHSTTFIALCSRQFGWSIGGQLSRLSAPLNGEDQLIKRRAATIDFAGDFSQPSQNLITADQWLTGEIQP
jgi:hypothetical protein